MRASVILHASCGGCVRPAVAQDETRATTNHDSCRPGAFQPLPAQFKAQTKAIHPSTFGKASQLDVAPVAAPEGVEVLENQNSSHARGRPARQKDPSPHPPGTPAPPAPASRPGRARRLREHSSPGRFAVGDAREYKRFWRDAGWSVFLEPSPGGFAEARQRPATVEGTRAIQPTAGVYEFAVSLGREGKKVVVYVGESVDLHRRHHNDYRGPGGSHLKDCFEAALKSDLTVWRRFRYSASKAEAVRWEAFCLGQFDYAWNQKLNSKQEPRVVGVENQCLCFFPRVVVAATPPPAPAASAGRKR